MSFNVGEMRVFSRSGAYVGTLTTWAVAKTRSYKINDVDDFAFTVPQRDEEGNDVLTSAVAALLARDNLVYIENEIETMPGWGGAITEVTYADGAAFVEVLGGMSLFDQLDAALIEQTEGTSADIAQRLVSAANAKQGAHGDLVVGFVADGSTPNHGRYSYEGNVLQGLLRLAEDTIAECHMESYLSDNGMQLFIDLHWHEQFAIDFRADPNAQLQDGVNANIATGARAVYSSLEMVNHARMKGGSTRLGDFVDYAAVKNILTDISPEVEVEVPTPPNIRRREDLTLTVSFSYSEALQKQLATAMQDKYVAYYKSFLYALHNRWGRPFLEGYEWDGAASSRFPQKNLTETNYRTFQKLGRIGAATVITVDSDDEDVAEQSGGTAAISGWLYDTTIATSDCTGVAISHENPQEHIMAESTGMLRRLEEDGVTLTDMFNVAGAGETLQSVATDLAQSDAVWVLLTGAFGARIRWYDNDDGSLLGSYTIAGESNASDIVIDVNEGLLYMVSTGEANVQVRDLNNGLLLSPDQSFDSGFANPAGLSMSGGLVYVVNTAGQVRMLYNSSGNLAGTFDTSEDARGLLVDPDNRRIYVVNPSGTVSAFHANIAVGTVDDPEGTVGAPSFDTIVKGQFVHVVMSNAHTASMTNTAGPSTGYTVKSGDTLWAIAARYYGHGTSWPTIYKANKAVIEATAIAHGFSSSDNGHWIFPGTNLVIPGHAGGTSSAGSVTPTKKYIVVYQKADWTTHTVPGPIGSPDYLQKDWELKGDQVEGVVKASACTLVDPKIVIYGEEGRVGDWVPQRDGYGQYKTRQIYRTKRGRQLDAGAGWYPADWDVPDTEWMVPQQPWPEGEAYLTRYLKRRNAEVSVQSFQVVNKDQLWSKIRLGGVYTLTLSLTGPVDTGTTVDVRIIQFAPNELGGVCDVIAEVYIP